MKNLQGSLRLFCSEKSESKEETNEPEPDLTEEENLKRLDLNWDMKRKDNNSYNDLEVLEGLQPNKNFQSLRIHGFRGTRLHNNIFVEFKRDIFEWLQ